MKMGRREFIVGNAIGVGGGVLASRRAVAQLDEPGFFDPYELVSLGQTGIKVSRVSFGTGMRGWMRQSHQTRLGKDKFESLIRAAYDRGIRTFDMADLYGTHSYVASALKGIDRNSYVLVSKIWWRRGGIPEKERPAADILVDRFLKEIGTDYIDIVLLHCVDKGDWAEKLRGQMDILAGLKEKGVIKAHGVSCHSIDALNTAADEPWTEVVFSRINPYGKVMDGPPEQVVPILQKLHKAGKGVVGMKLIGEGAFRDSEEKRDRSVSFVLGLGCVDMLNVGFESVDEIDDFAARVRKVPIKET